MKVEEPWPIAFNTMVQNSVKSAFEGETFPDAAVLHVTGDHVFNGVRTNLFLNTSFTKNTDGKWAGDKYWPAGGVMDFCAYYDNRESQTPKTVTPSWTNAQRLELTMADNSTQQGDFLYGVANDKVASAAVPMTFYHAQAWLQFTAKATAPEDFYLDRIEVLKPYTAGKFVVDNSKVDLEAYWTDLTKHMTGEPAAATDVKVPGWNGGTVAASTATAPTIIGSGLLLPAQETTKFVIYYKYKTGTDGGNPTYTPVYKYTYNLARGQWEMGKKYIYNITFNNNQIVIDTDVEDWTSAPQENVDL